MLIPLLARAQVALARLAGMLLARPPRRRSRSMPSLDTIRRIVVIRLDEIGDVVIASAFLRDLRQAAPNARITLVVQPGIADIVRALPHVDEVLAYDVRCRRSLRPFVLPVRALMYALARLRPLDPELTILPRWDADQVYATMLARFTGAPYRVGYSENVRAYKRRINAGFDGLLTHVLDERGVTHEVERSRALLRWLGGESSERGPELAWTEEDSTTVDRLLGPVTDDRSWVALCPSYGHSVLKQWPVGHFAELARRLAARDDVRLLIVGGPADRPLAASIVEAVGGRALDLTGRTTLAQLPALLSRCTLLVGADTGVAHAGSAVGIPVIGLMGPTNVVRFAPWQGDVVTLDMPCSPVHRMPEEDRCPRCILGAPRCMLDLSPDQVFDAVTRRLGASRGSASPPAAGRA